MKRETTRKSKDKWQKVQETVHDVLTEKRGNEMLYSDLLEMVNNYFHFTISSHGLGMMLTKQKKQGYIQMDIRMVGGKRERYWKLVEPCKETFVVKYMEAPTKET